MITFPKIKAASYAIGKRLQGYHLLQNPSGTPQTEVNMIKTLHDGINKAGLRTTVTSRIIRTSDDLGNTNVEKRNLHSYRIYDFENNKFGKAVNKELFIFNDSSKIYKQNEYSAYELSKLKEHSMQEMSEAQKQMREFNEKIESKRPNFFKVLYQNLRGK